MATLERTDPASRSVSPAPTYLTRVPPDTSSMSDLSRTFHTVGRAPSGLAVRPAVAPPAAAPVAPRPCDEPVRPAVAAAATPLVRPAMTVNSLRILRSLEPLASTPPSAFDNDDRPLRCAVQCSAVQEAGRQGCRYLGPCRPPQMSGVVIRGTK